MKNVTPDDAELVISLKNGNQSAITQIYNKYWKKLLAIAYNELKVKSDAEEVVQNVLINLWDRREVLQINALPNYLATAVKYSIFRVLQRQKRKEEVSNAILKLHSPFDHDDERIYAIFLEDYINGQVEKLPEKCKLVFKYSRQKGLSIQEISQELAIAEKTVESHLTKALKFLRSSLKERGDLFLFAFFSLIAAAAKLYLWR